LTNIDAAFNFVDAITNAKKKVIVASVNGKKLDKTTLGLLLQEISKKPIFLKPLSEPFTDILSSEFAKKKCQLYRGNSIFDYYIKKGKYVYGLNVITDDVLMHESLMNLYRDLSATAYPSYNLWLTESVKSLEKEIKRIVKEIDNGKKGN
jgi:hypothetical protein